MTSTIKKVFATLAMTAAAIVSIGAMSAASADTASPTTVHPNSAEGCCGRSTQVLLDNHSQCELELYSVHLDHGNFSSYPNFSIDNGIQGEWTGHSDGFMTGTQGNVVYRARFCADPANENQFVQIGWNNPYYGSNSYSYTAGGTMHPVPLNDGSGNDAKIEFFLHV